MAPWKEYHLFALFWLVEVLVNGVVAVRNPTFVQETHYTAASFGQAVTLVCDMSGRNRRYPMMWFSVDTGGYISKSDRLFPTLDEDRLNRYSSWMEVDLNQYMLRIDNVLIRDGGKYVCGYNDNGKNKFVPLWDTTLVVFQPPEDNTLACDVTYLNTDAGPQERLVEISCSWNIELLNVDIALFRGRTNIEPDLKFNGRMIRRLKVGRFTHQNNFRCVMIHPDQNRQSAPCRLPPQDPVPVVHVSPLIRSAIEGSSTDFTCDAQNQRKSGVIWTPNCSGFSSSLDVCKRISLVNGGATLRISNPQLGDDGMLIQCSVHTPGGLMAAGVAQLIVDSAPSTAGDAGLRGEGSKGTERGWTSNPHERNHGIDATSPDTTLEAIPFTLHPTQGPRPKPEYSRSVYATIIPVVIVIVLLILVAYTCLSRCRTMYYKRRRKQQSDGTMDDRFFESNDRMSYPLTDKVIDAVRSIPAFLKKVHRTRSARRKLVGQRPSPPASSAWASRGSVPRAISPISITPDLFRTSPDHFHYNSHQDQFGTSQDRFHSSPDPIHSSRDYFDRSPEPFHSPSPEPFRTAHMMPTSTRMGRKGPPPKPPPKSISRGEALYQNTMSDNQPSEITRTDTRYDPRMDPKLILVRPSKIYDFVRISNDIARGYTNLRPDAVLSTAPKNKCIFTEDENGYLMRSARKNIRF